MEGMWKESELLKQKKEDKIIVIHARLYMHPEFEKVEERWKGKQKRNKMTEGKILICQPLRNQKLKQPNRAKRLYPNISLEHGVTQSLTHWVNLLLSNCDLWTLGSTGVKPNSERGSQNHVNLREQCQRSPVRSWGIWAKQGPYVNRYTFKTKITPYFPSPLTLL